MPIANMTNDHLSTIMSELFTPSKEISTPERLLGRERRLVEIERSFASQGRHVFVYGDRGVGKTSLAVTAAHLHNHSSRDPIYIPCGESTTFYDVVHSIALKGIGARGKGQKGASRNNSGGFSAGLAGIGNIAANFTKEAKAPVLKPNNFVEVIDQLRSIFKNLEGRTIVVIDEFDRIRREEDKSQFSELIKNSSAIDADIRFIFCGIGRNVEEILGAHLSAGRYFEPIELEKLHYNFLYDITNEVAMRASVTVPQETTKRIAIVSDGFPHFVHLIGQCMFWAMQDDPQTVVKCERRHYDEGIKGALEKTEPMLRLAWQRATEKTKNRTQYEEALWALADKAETRRQVSDIYERSYKRIMQNRLPPLDQPTLNNRLLMLRKETHGEIVVGYGSGYFAFRENVLRGYARLKAEAEGVELTPDPT